MSLRHDAFDTIVQFLTDHRRTFNAPYGILEGKTPGKGVGSVICYSVTFGIARYMDATITVYNANKIVFDSSGSHTELNGTYLRADSLINVLKYHFKIGFNLEESNLKVGRGIPSVMFKPTELAFEHGDTRTSLRNADYLLRTYGKPVSIELIRGEDCNYGVLAIWKGTMHLFTGFAWGYSGEGPSGLDEFLRAAGTWKHLIAKNIRIEKK